MFTKQLTMSNATPTVSAMFSMRQIQPVPFDSSTGLLLLTQNLSPLISTSGTVQTIDVIPSPQNEQMTSQLLFTENRLGTPTYSQEFIQHQIVMQYSSFEETPMANRKDIPPKTLSCYSGKTFPSTTVQVQPCLQDKLNKSEADKSRSDLDARVKCLLLLTPSELTKWLMQCGLLRLEHKCGSHMTEKPSTPYKLVIFSDVNEQPFSGGYVWISECCPNIQMSVFQGSIFEAAVYPPDVLVKLIYHWACQTTVKNIPKWVEVSLFYVKNFFTLLRSACVASLHEICPILGGEEKNIEIGIITLGSTTAIQEGKRQVKIEILGVFDPTSKIIRMKVIYPHNSGVSSATDNPTQILWPLNHWVDKSSIILIDESIDRTILMDMGFKNVQVKTQRNSTPISTSPSNANVMNYLHYVVPVMFKNTLCDISINLVQQFLDELSWREIWGSTPSTAFDNMINQIATMTQWNAGESLISRLNKFSLDPFEEWPYSRISSLREIKLPPNYIRVDMPAVFTVQTPVVIPETVSRLEASVVETRSKADMASKSAVLLSQMQPSAVMNANEVVTD